MTVVVVVVALLVALVGAAAVSIILTFCGFASFGSITVLLHDPRGFGWDGRCMNRAIASIRGISSQVHGRFLST